ncbi:hypothetical protein CCUS01_10580 [Colletotrichum cuscutae]|uniref:Uncharacterized protein n=1 Tax=Colletotrichum cuscutae TaxID=1209917 RepID=A0AAI9UE20_9PEZI|nr:hypothetical protein CCUS01_10580 [Colletotrichum cuscutae]
MSSLRYVRPSRSSLAYNTTTTTTRVRKKGSVLARGVCSVHPAECLANLYTQRSPHRMSPSRKAGQYSSPSLRPIRDAPTLTIYMMADEQRQRTCQTSWTCVLHL